MNKATIMVVEDDAILAIQLQTSLLRLGYDVAGPVASGEEAIRFISTHSVDLVLMDVELPGCLNGINAAEAIVHAHDIPIVFLTGVSQGAVIKQAKRVGPYGYIIKPVSQWQLAATVEMALNRHSLDRMLKEGQAALEKSETKFRQLFENLPIGIFRTALDGTVLDGNREMMRLVGCRSAEEVKQHYSDMPGYLYVDLEQRNELIRLLRGKGAVENFEFLARKADGSTIWLSISALLKIDDTGEPVIEGFAKEVTDRKLAELQLTKSKERYRTLSSLTSDVAYAFRKEAGGYRIEWIVGAAEEITGYSIQEIRESGCWSFLVIDEDLPLFDRHIAGLFPGSTSICDLRLRHKDGTLRWVECRTKCSASSDGTVAVFGSIVDRTDKKKLKETLQLVAETGVTPGQDIFRFLVSNLAAALGKRLVVLSRICTADPLTAHTVAVWLDGRLMENFSYPLANTPCEHVSKRGASFFPSHLKKLYPMHPLLDIMDAESYRSVSLRTGDGEFMGILAVLDDRPMKESSMADTLLRTFAARAAAELERMKSQENYESLFRQMLDGFAVHEIICDGSGAPTDYRFISVNPAFERMTGLHGADIVGRTVLEVMPQLERHWISTYGRVALTGEPAHFSSYDNFSGKHFEVTAFSPERNMFACIVKDISERKRWEDKLRQSEQQFRLFVEASPDAIFVQVGMRFAYVNQACIRLYGATNAGELLGTNVLERFNESFHPIIHERIRILIEKKQFVSQVEQIHLRLDGTEVPVEVAASPITFEGKDGALVYVRDITERKRLEDERIKLREQLYHAQRMEDIGRLTGGVAHDFNNHLTAIIGCSHIILSRIEEDSDLRHFAEMINSAGEKASALTRSLLTFSRRQPPEMAPVDLQVISENLTKLLRRLIGEDIDFVVEADPHPLFINADSGQIEQVLMNLATNARDAMPNGGMIRLNLTRTWVDPAFVQPSNGIKPGDYAVISFTDTGVGIPAEQREKVFEPFYTTKESGKGTGLGLSIVMGIIQQHQGHILVDSAPGRGTTFTIYLPLIRKESRDTHSLEQPQIAGGEETVLVCEDDWTVRRLISLVLKDAGYQVLEAEDGEQAVEMFKTHLERISMVVMDVVMPKKNGVAVFTDLETLKPGIRVIFTSGYTPETINRSGLFQMKLPFIQKPIIPSLLLKKVRETLDAQIAYGAD